jgi:hypothetical protein
MSQFALPDMSSLIDIMFYYLIEMNWINGSVCEQVTLNLNWILDRPWIIKFDVEVTGRGLKFLT